MLVKSAFEGARKSWFLFVDASSLKQHGDNQFPSKLDVALLCITKTPSGDKNNLLHGSPSKRLSLLDTSPLPQPGIIQPMNQKVPNSDQSGPGDSSQVVRKYLETEVKHVTDDLCKNLSSDSKRWSDSEVEKFDLLSKGNKIPETNVEHKDDNCRVGVNDVQCNNSPEGSLRTGPASKKKRRSKKKSEDAISDFTLKDNTTSNLASHPGIIGPEFSSGVLNEMEMENVDVGKEPCKTSFFDINMRSDSGEIPGTHVEYSNNKFRNMIGDVHCNGLLVEASKSRSTAKKKRKRENKGAGNPSEENKDLLSNNRETSKPKAIIPDNSIEDKQKTTTATSDCLFTEPLEDVNLVASSNSGKKKRKSKNKLPSSPDQVVTAEPFSPHDVREESFKGTMDLVAKDSDRASDAAIVSEQNVQHETLSGPSGVSQKEKNPEPIQEVVEGKKKRKRKNKLPISHDQVAIAEPFSLHDVREESFKGTVDIVAKNSDRASDAAIVSEENVQHETLSGPSGVSQKEKHPEPVQEVVEEGKKLPSSIGIDVSGPDAENAKGRSDSPGLGAGGSKGTKKSKKHHSTNVKEFPLLAVNEFDNLKKDVTHSGQENIVPDDHKVEETSHPDKIEEQRKLPQNRDPELMLSEKCEPPSQGEADLGTKEAVALSNLSETNIAMESAKSAGSRRMKKTAKKSVATKQVMSSMEHADNSASGVSSTAPRSIFNDHSSVEAKKEESILSQTERTKISKLKIVDTSFIDANGKGDDMSGNEAESLPLTQVNTTQENAENMDGNLRKKSKKNRSSDAKTLSDFPVIEQANKVGSPQLNQINTTRRSEEKMDEESGKIIKLNQNSAAKSLPDFPVKEQEIGGEELTSSNDRLREVDAPSRTKRKTKSVKTSSKDQLTGQELELENSGIEHGFFHPQQKLMTVDSTQIPSSDVDGSAFKNGKMDKANDHIEVSKCDGDRVNFKDYFVSAEHQHEVTPVELVVVDKMIEEKKSAMEVKAKKNAKKLVVPSSATSPDVQDSLKSYVNQGSERKSHGRNSSHIQHQESLSKDEHNEVGLHSKSSKVSDNGVKAPDSHHVEQIKTIPQEAKHFGALNGSKTRNFVPAHPKENNESSSATSSCSESSEKNLQNKKETKRQTVQNSLKSCVNQGSERKSHGRNSSHVQHQESLSKDEHYEDGLHLKSSKVSENGVKAPDSHHVEQIKTIPQEAKQFGAVNGSKTNSSLPAHPKENNESSSTRSSSSESSEKNLRNKKETKRQLSLDRHHVTVSKASSKKMGKVVNSSQYEKSLLATPAAIFRDGSSESSEDEYGAVNSDSSTRTPSDNSSSSGYSEGESMSSLDSPRNGSYGAKGKDSRKSNIKSQIPGPKDITMDMILRSSSRFKKAKLTAAQLQLDDTESQPVDIVPDSQANL